MADDGQPERIVVAGDWHGNTGWAAHVIGMAADALDGEPRKTILHLGDFGIWPGRAGGAYLDGVARALGSHGMDLCFVDGNHEDHDCLDAIRSASAALDSALVAPGIWWLYRGSRWTWHGRTWLALGGGVSVDRAIRTEGRSWWPQEEISDAQEGLAVLPGRADVMVTHDCPSGITHTFPPPPAFWDARDLARSDAHRDRLQRVVDAVQPSHLMHGHLHRSYRRTCDFGYGPVEVTGLDCDEGDGANWAVLDVRTMTWAAAGPEGQERSGEERPGRG